MKKSSRFKNLRAYVDAQPRGKTQGQIAEDLGLAENTLSLYLGAHRIPSREVALRLSRDHGIDLEGLLDPQSADREKRSA